ncbi:hypothetical protein FD17_GL000625 [Lentilactobacillus sunkii DSM 19904]|uniref:Uncharacterized protein n=1 Tax=Lentilactobacillus sunkii DSM 19904 TaxID=1423808 RepID=A0A0R1L5N4_9LACO|nr:hypothetical protein FD17_GL000625 [Lentilactobacillus sunkii DSM 19904]
MFTWIHKHHIQRLFVLIHDAAIRNHFTNHKTRTIFLTDNSECRVCDPSHRSNHELIRDRNITNIPFHAFTSKFVYPL